MATRRCGNPQPHARHHTGREEWGQAGHGGFMDDIWCPGVMSKAQQAAEERWPLYPAVGFNRAGDRQVAFLTGVAWALPEVPDPAVIEAMARAAHENPHDWQVASGDWGAAGHEIKEQFRAHARAAYTAMRGAMQ